ncbi:MAG: hypothetical protein RL136_1175 [Planctomycetota bacterium]|jgi:hypothetical protein
MYLRFMLIQSLVLSSLAVASLLTAPPAKPLTQPTPLRAMPALPSAWVTPVGAGFRFAEGLHAAIAAHDVRDTVIVVPIEGVGDKRLRLRRFNGVALDARVEVGATKRAERAELSAALHGVAHFEGTVDGSETGSCYIAFGATGAAGWIDLGDEGSFALRRVSSDAPGLCAGEVEFVRSAGTSAPDVPTCGGVHEEHEHGDGGIAGFGDVPPGVRKVVEIAVDSDFDYYRIFGDETAATEYIGTLVGAIAAIYRRDCDATFVTAYLRLQTDEADLFNESDPLVPFRQYWDANGADIDRDLFTLITGRRNLPYGGVAYLNAACASFGYSVNGYINGRFVDPIVTNPGNWDINVAAHEWGHNCGTRHTHDYGIDGCASGVVQRGTIMSYCHVVQGASSNIDLRFHRGTGEAIEAFIATAPCLASDCNDNGIADADEIAVDGGLDVNGDGVLDACQDCNGNGQPDPVEILLGAEEDADGDLLPDSCERDCDGDGTPDSLEIAFDPSLDLDGNRELDACQTDCDGNGAADAVEIIGDMGLDRSRDGRIDACEDCDGDGVPDFIELAGSRSRWVASAGDTVLRELDPRSGVVRREVACGQFAINDLAIGADGRLYAATGDRVFALDRVNDAAASGWSVVLGGEARSIAVGPGGALFVLLADGTVHRLAADGSIDSTVVSGGPPAGIAFDMVFRTVPGGGTDILVSYTAGVIRRIDLANGAGSVFADRSADLPEYRGLYAMADGSVLVASATLAAIVRFDATGAYLGEWDVENGAMLGEPHSICDAGDGRAVLATSASSSSTVNGYNLATGYTERTYRVYPADAPAATAIVIAPPSATDADGDLIPDECQGTPNPADLNGDGAVDAADLAALLNAWGACAGCAADLDGDGSVGASDLAVLLNAWG